ncbi:N-acetylmuramoyl-L-alanine amidase [Streptomycetaceae bacterium NBC_01309]
MAWCPFATRMELQPESNQQAGIDPTQFIVHSIAAPWTNQRMYEYWRDSTNLESHFGGAFDGGLAQFIGTETRADANASANRRPDGTGAVSIETASNLQHSDPWTDAQVATLIRLGVWLHQRHGIPLRVCRSASDPGFGYHGLHRAWSTSGTACPGPARIRQFREVVFPGIVRAASGGPVPTPKPQPEVPSTPVKRKRMAQIGKTIPRVLGDESATTFTAVPGRCFINVSADYVPPGEEATVRIDVADGNKNWIQVNHIMRLGSGEAEALELARPDKTRVVSVKRLSHEVARLDATLHHPEG